MKSLKYFDILFVIIFIIKFSGENIFKWQIPSVIPQLLYAYATLKIGIILYSYYYGKSNKA